MICKDEHDKGLSLPRPEIFISNTSLVSHLNDPIHKKMSSPQNVHLLEISLKLTTWRPKF